MSGAESSFAEFMERPLGGGRLLNMPRVDLLSGKFDAVLLTAADGAVVLAAGEFSVADAGAAAERAVSSLVHAGMRTMPGAEPS